MALVERDERILQQAVEAGKFTYEEYKGPWNEDMKLLDPFGLLEYVFYTCKIEGDDREYICAVSELDSEDTKTMLTREILRQMVCKPISKGDKITDINGMSFYYAGWNVHGWHVVYTKGVRNDFKVIKEKHILPTEMDCKEIYRKFYEEKKYLEKNVGKYDVCVYGYVYIVEAENENVAKMIACDLYHKETKLKANADDEAVVWKIHGEYPYKWQ